jgi:hypothetical protein
MPVLSEMRQGGQALKSSVVHGRLDGRQYRTDRMHTHLHRPYDDTVSAYVIADEGGTFFIAMHRVLACPTSPKKSYGHHGHHIFARTTG